MVLEATAMLKLEKRKTMVERIRRDSLVRPYLSM